MQRILCILPKGEGFSPAHSGAIALSVRDFTYSSRYRTSIQVIGGVRGPGFEGIHYNAIPQARWFENRTRSYANGCIRIINNGQTALAEIHNRPAIVNLIAKKVRCKLALHLHNDPQEMDGARTTDDRRKLLHQCAGIYCVSNYIRERFLEGLDRNLQFKLHIVPNGISIPATLPPKEKLIVFAGRITEDKGVLPLAKALRMALPKLPGWRAVLIGGRRFEISKTLSLYEKQVAETLHPIIAQARLTGYIPHEETLAFFARAAIAVVPSLWQEPFGRTALEALSVGAAVISSGRGGLHEITAEAALKVNDVTPEALSAAIIALATKPQECERLQRMGRERATHFSIAECTKTLDDVRALILAGDNSNAA